jgi:hypothetical protein
MTVPGIGAGEEITTPRGPARKLVFTTGCAVRTPIVAVDLEWVRREFAAMFDQAAQAVETAGYSLDDAITDRFLRLHPPGRDAIEVQAGVLGDHERFEAFCRGVLSRAGMGDATFDGTYLERLVVRTYVDRD